MLRHGRQTVAGQGDDALLWLAVQPLGDGEGEVAVAQQHSGGDFRVRRQLGEGFQVDAPVAAQRPGIGAVHHQHRDRAVALGLQAEGAGEFQRRGQGGRQCQGLPQKDADRFRMVVAGEQGVGQRAEADEPAADRLLRQIKRGDAARNGQVRHVRPGAVEKGGKVAHTPQDRQDFWR